MNSKRPQQQQDKMIDEVRKKIRLRKKQLAFDDYPEDFADFLTRIGMNPYKDGFEERIQYRDFTVQVKEK